MHACTRTFHQEHVQRLVLLISLVALFVTELFFQLVILCKSSPVFPPFYWGKTPNKSRNPTLKLIRIPDYKS